MQKRRISEPGVEPNVYDFVKDKVEAMNWERNDKPYPANGWDAKALMQTNGRDIADKEVRPDVYVTVRKMVDPAAHFRSDKPPTEGLFEPYKGVQEAFPPPTKTKKEKNPDGLDALVQLNSQFLGNPERVNVLDPIAFQTRANGNTLDGGIQIRRTTFY